MRSLTPLVTIVVAGRNDDYGGNFRERLFRTAAHNAELFERAGLPFEYLLVEWNPLPDRELLSEEFVRRVSGGRAIVVSAGVHDTFAPNSTMPFHEMPAKNAGIHRARAPWIVVTNADVLFGPETVSGLANGRLDPRRLYRARRVDVPADATWEDMQDSRNHLQSGEGRTAPVDYLGAGGDFCLASRELWHQLRGFDERVRFSTRGKDWQFFLSARERGIPIEFTGTVFHLDHDGGFRNTRPEDRLSSSVHFGLPWDLEFGLPTLNRADWGVQRATSRGLVSEPIDVLEGPLPADSTSLTSSECLKDWLAGAVPDWISAACLHAIFGAYRSTRRLWVTLQSGRAAARLQGFLPIARHLGVEVCGRWHWPPLEGFTVAPLSSGPLGGPTRGDGCLAEEESRLSLSIDGLSAALFPRRRPAAAPVFNPLLARRLLRTWAELRATGARRVLIYGAGSHTRELLSYGWPDCQTLTGIVVTEGPDARFGDLPVTALDRINPRIADAIVLSSASYEPEMLEAARAAGFAQVIPLYSSWPVGLTQSREAQASMAAGSRQ